MNKHELDTTHFLLGVSAKHFREDVSTTVSQKATTGSATLMSAGGGAFKTIACDGLTYVRVQEEVRHAGAIRLMIS